jgi:RNA polymerase sigma-70 factor, ECF subfamily
MENPGGWTVLKNRQEDMALIQAFGLGDARAGDALATKYYSRVVNICYGQLNSWDEARDVAQEIFVKVLGERKILNFRGEAKLETWLYRISINTCRTRQVRRRKLLPVWLGSRVPSGLEAMPSLERSPEEVCVQKRHGEWIQGMLRQLPRKYQEIIRLVCLEECSYKEAARRLKIPTAHLGVRLMRGKMLLSKLREASWREYGRN